MNNVRDSHCNQKTRRIQASKDVVDMSHRACEKVSDIPANATFGYDASKLEQGFLWILHTIKGFRIKRWMCFHKRLQSFIKN